MPIRILTALVNKITIRKAFYISSAFFYFLIKLTTICFYLKRWCYTVLLQTFILFTHRERTYK